MSEEVKEKSDKSVWALWKLWALDRMRYLDPSQTSYDNAQIKHQQELLLARSQTNIKKLFTDPKNRNHMGKFDFYKAQENLMTSLNENELDQMIGFCDSFQSDINQQLSHLQRAAFRNKDEDEKFRNDDALASKSSARTENSVWSLWKMWALNRMIFVDKSKSPLDKIQMQRQINHLMTRTDENVKGMFDNPQNRNRHGHFDLVCAKQALMDSLTESELASMIRYSKSFGNEIRRQKQFLLQTKTKLKQQSK